MEKSGQHCPFQRQRARPAAQCQGDRSAAAGPFKIAIDAAYRALPRGDASKIRAPPDRTQAWKSGSGWRRPGGARGVEVAGAGPLRWCLGVGQSEAYVQADAGRTRLMLGFRKSLLHTAEKPARFAAVAQTIVSIGYIVQPFMRWGRICLPGGQCLEVLLRT